VGIEVENDYNVVAKRKDQQLEAAIAVLLKIIEPGVIVP